MIVEIIDHNRALIEGPATSVPRQAFPYRHLILTPYTLAKLPRAAGSGAVKKAFEKSGVSEKWEASAWAKKLAARQVRKVSQTVADRSRPTPFANVPSRTRPTSTASRSWSPRSSAGTSSARLTSRSARPRPKF